MRTILRKVRQKVRAIIAKRNSDKLRQGLEVTLSDKYGTYTFYCTNFIEHGRAKTLFTKEAGTIEWLNQYVKPNQVIYDIGANIGLYTITSARRTGSQGRVYAFEPHLPNATSLLRNVAINRLTEQVEVLSCALHSTDGFFPFQYFHAEAGSSQSQLGMAFDDQGVAFKPVSKELKAAYSVDSLIKNQVVQTPDHIKIDVDGNEIEVLRGMENCLKNTPPISLQIEINPSRGREIHNFLEPFGYQQIIRHDTELGKSKIAAGQEPETVSHNAVFTRVTS